MQVYRESAAGDPDPVAYHGPGRVLELPVFDPSVHDGSVYLWYDTASQRERPGGYSTTAPRAAKDTADRLQRLNCGDWSGDTAGELDRLGVRAIALHLGLYDRVDASGSAAWFAWQRLLDHGWRCNARPARCGCSSIGAEVCARHCARRIRQPPFSAKAGTATPATVGT